MFSLFDGIPFGPHPLAETKREAIDKAGGQLVDVDVETDWIWAVLGHVICTKVTGTGPLVGADHAKQAPAPAPVTTDAAPQNTPPATVTAEVIAIRRVVIENKADFDSQGDTLRSWVGMGVIIGRQSEEPVSGKLARVGPDWLGLVRDDGTKVKVPGRKLSYVELAP